MTGYRIYEIPKKKKLNNIISYHILLFSQIFQGRTNPVQYSHLSLSSYLTAVSLELELAWFLPAVPELAAAGEGGPGAAEGVAGAAAPHRAPTAPRGATTPQNTTQHSRPEASTTLEGPEMFLR